MLFRSEQLDAYFRDHSYCIGYAPTNRDAELFVLVHAHIDMEKYPHLGRWFMHMCSFPNKCAFETVEDEFKFECATCGAGCPKKEECKKCCECKKEEKEEEEEEGDLFGDDDDEDDSAVEAMQAKLKAEAEKKKAEAKKDAKVERSLLVLHVKPYDETTDLKALYEKIKNTPVKGCKWGEQCNIKPLAFGICFIEMSCVIEDEVCSEDDVTDAITQFEDEVQSVETVSFNKFS